MLFWEILRAPYRNQGVNGVLMYSNTECKNEAKGKELVKIINICDSRAH